tara:strand:+ start:5513 stop:6100 length:588 start_codon:yes stop_codon:yes gene_type:complete
MDYQKIIKQNFEESINTSKTSSSELIESINIATLKILQVIDNGGKILSCGNGGSSGDAQHLSSELVNRFEKERRELAGISLNSDTAIMTAIANDYDYKFIFSKQINAIANSGDDLLIAFTTSGNSENILEALKAAKSKNIPTILITGNDGGKASGLLDSNFDHEIRVPSNRTSRIQEIHLIIIHSICECIDNYIS